MSKEMIRLLKEIFSRFALPKVIVSNNGTQFTSDIFNRFCQTNNIKHIKPAPYHLKSNSLAERYKQTFKRSFSVSGNEKID